MFKQIIIEEKLRGSQLKHWCDARDAVLNLAMSTLVDGMAGAYRILVEFVALELYEPPARRGSLYLDLRFLEQPAGLREQLQALLVPQKDDRGIRLELQAFATEKEFAEFEAGTKK